MSDETPDRPSELRSSVEKARKKRRAVLFTAAGVAVVGLAVGAVGIVTTLNRSDVAVAGESDRFELRIATSEDRDYMTAVGEVAAENGLDIEWVNVSDWVLPNTELAAGNVDGNSFQHIIYLSQFNTESDETLTPLFSTLILQFGIFSATIDDLSDIPEGGRIAIPDDPANSGRALYILEASGLLDIADDAGNLPTQDDITANPLNLEIVEIGATTIPQQFDDPSLSAVVIGTNYFDPSQGIKNEDALYLDDSLSEESLPYVNTIVSRRDNADDPAWEVLEEAFRDPRVEAAVQDEWKGATKLVDIPAETLQSKLAELEDEAREQAGE